MMNLCSRQARNAIKLKVKCSNNSKFVLGTYGSCNALHNILTLMHIKFEDVQAVYDKVIFQTSRKCCKNFNQREINVLLQKTMNAKFEANQTGDDEVMLRTVNYSTELSN